MSFLNKKPLVIGGEHTISYFCFKGLSDQEPLLIHFDAHRDMKETFRGMKMCHATPFFRLIEEECIKGRDITQIGIRQADREEDQVAEDKGVVTFDAWNVKENFKELLAYITKITKNRKIYISFDIDVLDLQYVPCTVTPEPFGLDPFEIIKILNSINDSAVLIGLDLVETSLKNDDYREGTLASQILLRILSKKYVRNLNALPK
jgi:arginase family enzyme